MCSTQNLQENDILELNQINVCSEQVSVTHVVDVHATQWPSPADPPFYLSSTSKIKFDKDISSREPVVTIQTNSLTKSILVVFESSDCRFTMEVEGLRHTFFHSCPGSR